MNLALRVVAAIILTMAVVGEMATAATVPQVTALPPITEGVNTPVRIATDPSGNFYVADPRGGGVLKYSGSGRLLQVIATSGAPQAVAVTSSGSLLVSQGRFVSLMDQAGKELRKLGAGAGQFKMANGIALDASGRIYVVDSLDNCVQVFTSTGEYVTRFGALGAGSGQLSMPTAIAYEKVANQLAVVDTLNGRIQFFDTNGVYQRTVGAFGSGPLNLTFPLGVTFQYGTGASPTLERMYVTDSFQGNVQVIDPTGSGTFLSVVGTHGTGSGQLLTPSDALFDPVGSRLVVANAAGSLNLYGIGTQFSPIDTTPPSLTLVPLPPTTTAASQVVTGTVEAGATVTVSINGAPASSVAVSGTSWSTALSLVPGINSLVVKGADSSGNVTTASASITLIIPTTTFTVEPVPPLIGAPSQTLSGARGAGVTLAVTNTTTGTAGTITYPTASTWRCELSGLAEGENLITVAAGSISENLAVTVDSRPPVLAVSALKNGSRASARVQNVTVRVADPHLDKVTVNGTAATVTDGSASAAIILADGPTAITVTAADKVGNVTTDTRSITFDPTAPSLVIISPADGIRTSTPVVELTGIVAPDATVTVNGVAALMSGTSWSRRVDLAAGLNTIEVIARDLSGKSAASKRTVVYEAALPQVAIISPGDDAASAAESLVISGTTESGVTISAAVNGATVPADIAGNTFSVTVPLSREGNYAVTVTATDPFGGAGSVSRNVISDRTLPRLLITSPTVPAPTVVTGVADRDATVMATDRSGTTVVVPVADGSWSLDLAASLLDPATLLVTATDAAGNAMVRTLAAPVPNGDVDGDGAVTITDVLRTLRVSVGLIAPAAGDYANGDIGPLVDGKVNPDGRIDLQDTILILRRVVGVLTW